MPPKKSSTDVLNKAKFGRPGNTLKMGIVGLPSKILLIQIREKKIKKNIDASFKIHIKSSRDDQCQLQFSLYQPPPLTRTLACLVAPSFWFSYSFIHFFFPANVLWTFGTENDLCPRLDRAIYLFFPGKKKILEL